MSKRSAKPELVSFSELADGQNADTFARLADKTRSLTRDGKPFFACHFADARRKASVMVWQDSRWFLDCENDWQTGGYYKLRATFQDHPRYGPQLEIHNIRAVTDDDRADGFDEANLEERSRFDSEVMFEELTTLVETHIEDEPLRMVVRGILERHVETIKRLPASPRHYFPFPGGWLEHTLSVLKNCLWLCERYREYYTELTPPLNRDLIVAAAALHEIGRVAELEPTEPYDATIDGRLFGHIALGRDIVRDAVRQSEELNPELARLLEHVMHAYLTLPEWGSPRLPMIPEVLILHHADDLDAKLEMYVRCLSRDKSDGPFTERDPILGKQLFRARDV